MTTIDNFTKTARLKSKPANVSAATWANAINWSIEAWKCVLGGQKWVHTFEVCCPEQYYLLLDDKGKFILEDSENVKFSNSIANGMWVSKLEKLVIDMRSKSEFNESRQWANLIAKIRDNQDNTPNEDAFKKSKTVVKGHRLIRIKSAA